jgi:hypothetical protein
MPLLFVLVIPPWLAGPGWTPRFIQLSESLDHCGAVVFYIYLVDSFLRRYKQPTLKLQHRNHGGRIKGIAQADTLRPWSCGWLIT